MQKRPTSLTPQDQRIIDIISSTSKIPLNTSKVLAFFLSFKSGTSSEIERTMDMRQPEVSTATRFLISAKYLTKREVSKNGKGRPVIHYDLSSSPTKIIDSIKQTITDNYQKQCDMIKDLRILIQQ